MPVQSNINKELDTVNKKIANFIVVKDTIGLSEETKKQLDVLMKTKSDLEKKLNRLVSVQKAQQKHRTNKKLKLEQLYQACPEAALKPKPKG